MNKHDHAPRGQRPRPAGGNPPEYCTCTAATYASNIRCTQCGSALCPTCAAKRDHAGRGPECHKRPPNPDNPGNMLPH